MQYKRHNTFLILPNKYYATLSPHLGIGGGVGVDLEEEETFSLLIFWFDDEDVYVAWFREISWKRNCVQNNKSMYYIRDYLFHISVRYEKELVLILTYFMHRNSDDKYCEKTLRNQLFSY